MTWKSLSALMRATRCEFTKSLAAQHCFVRTTSNRWCRVLGAPPVNARHIRGRIYHMPL